MSDTLDDRLLLSQVLRMEHWLIKERMHTLGLSRGGVPVLFNLSGGRQKSQRELSRCGHLAPATIHATVKKLVEMRLVERLPDEDGRVVRLGLTQEGEVMAERTRAEIAEVHQRMLEGFTVEERVLLRRFLLQMRGNLEKLERKTRENVP